MNKTQGFLLRARKDLGLRVIIPFELHLDSKRKLSAEALLPDLGYPNGTIVSQSSDNFLALVEELGALRYGLSVYGEPSPNEEYDVESYKDMFIEWGWGSKNEKPSWFP